jgi:hypothetical protein
MEREQRSVPEDVDLMLDDGFVVLTYSVQYDDVVY